MLTLLTVPTWAYILSGIIITAFIFTITIATRNYLRSTRIDRKLDRKAKEAERRELDGLEKYGNRRFGR